MNELEDRLEKFIDSLFLAITEGSLKMDMYKLGPWVLDPLVEAYITATDGHTTEAIKEAVFEEIKPKFGDVIESATRRIVTARAYKRKQEV